ncbi:glycosyl hydrolase [Flagellimonas sp. DF-77]|uniref:glycosyl hydrolase n=1 Tax=Flagellimonas algarum TaxID=3230298 RepID=UPI003397BB3D
MKKPLLFLLILATLTSQAQRNKKPTDKDQDTPLSEVGLSGLKFRSLGPALTSGRISDIAVNPDNFNEYYVATSAGGVWKTVNAGNTFQPIFDGQGSYSIGCVTLDPNNPNVIWVGTGENNNQRSVSYGDGVYRSDDGGKSWQHLGLKTSEHIGKIIVHPEHPEIVYVAAIGPLWSAGGERGLYKTVDGGSTWEAVLTVDTHTGVNDVVMDPRNPDVLYASTFQRRRHVFTYIGGGPGSGIHKSTDGGSTWKKINKGLPKTTLGRIGLAISPADPEYLYAIVEAAQGKGGFFRSTNRGASWEKRGGYATSGNYYQEIFADPVDPNRVFAMNNWMRVTYDGGKTFDYVGEDFKHIDNHVIWINPNNTAHLLSGNDGGIYESWDNGKHWTFKPNLPVTQFYKVAVDNAKPFYNIYGGTQDNFSLGGPSRTVSANGPNNFDWFITHGGDGFESQIDPDNPDIVYAQSQYGNLVRYDKRSGEEKGIQPKERKGENSYRWNWDAPLAVSHHAQGRLYFAANKLFKSDDYGNSWQVISEDLSQNIDRNTIPVMGRVWGVEAVMKNQSTSPYGTIVSFSESPLNPDLLFVGTDDGLIQITEDGGANWRKVAGFSGVPKDTYVNAVFASKHDENVVYACFNNHKKGDFKPYVYKSSDKGRSWKSIANNLPERGSAYAFEQDHIDADLLFVGTEFGVFFSPNQGDEWKQLKSGLPPIAVRDIAIQEDQTDLVLGTFGRGFYVLDDYSSLRNITSSMEDQATLFPIRDALQFEDAYPLGLPDKAFMGDNFFIGDNLGAEAILTWHLKEGIKTKKDQRREAENKRLKDGGDNPYPSYETLEAEANETGPQLVLTITDANDILVRKLFTTPKAGVQRMHWDLRYASKEPIDFSKPPFYNPFGGGSKGAKVPPGRYSLRMSKIVDQVETPLGGPVSFEVVALNNTVLPAEDREALALFQQEVNEMAGKVESVQTTLGELSNELKYMKAAIKQTPKEHGDLLKAWKALEKEIFEIRKKINGDRIASRLDRGTPPSIGSRIGYLLYEQSNSTGSPTATHRQTFAIAKEEFAPVYERTKVLVNQKFEAFRKRLKSAGAPYTPGNLHFLD